MTNICTCSPHSLAKVPSIWKIWWRTLRSCLSRALGKASFKSTRKCSKSRRTRSSSRYSWASYMTLSQVTTISNSSFEVNLWIRTRSFSKSWGCTYKGQTCSSFACKWTSLSWSTSALTFSWVFERLSTPCFRRDLFLIMIGICSISWTSKMTSIWWQLGRLTQPNRMKMIWLTACKFSVRLREQKKWLFKLTHSEFRDQLWRPSPCRKLKWYYKHVRVVSSTSSQPGRQIKW